MIDACLDYAAEKKWPPLSVAVLDESGALLSFKRQDGANPSTADVALLKARTAARIRAPTAVLTPMLSQDAATRDTFLTLQLTALPGGAPLLRSDASLRGAVGVSGAQPAQDAACAQRAVAAVSESSGADNKEHDENAQEFPDVRKIADLSSAIRLAASAFERAWNQGDLRAATSPYDPSFVAIVGSTYSDYAKYVKSIETAMSSSDRPRLHLEINSVRALGNDYAVANGREHSVAKNGNEQISLFTVIFWRTEGQWKLIYAHS